MALLTAQELAKSSFPELPIRLSQRCSSTRTKPVAAKTFSSISFWPAFLSNAIAFVATLDNIVKKYSFFAHPFFPAADESEVRAAFGTMFFFLDQLAEDLNIPFRYRSGGSGRSYSYTDMVILDMSVAQDQQVRKRLSTRVYGDGKVKGPWQWKMRDRQELEDAFNDPKQQKKICEVIQQLFGDLVLDEASIGFLTNYNQTIFFRRSMNVMDKSLQFSPVIRITEAPIQAFMYVLAEAYHTRGVKQRLSRDLVPITPTRGHVLHLPPVVRVSRAGRSTRRPSSIVIVKAGKRGRNVRRRALDFSAFSVPVHDREDFVSLPQYTMLDLGLTGKIIGMGKFGNVLEGALSNGLCAAIKTFDLRFEQAADAFVHEQVAYATLRSLQGHCIPVVYAVGLLPHCDVVFIALSDEGNCELTSTRITRVQREKVFRALTQIHENRVLHNDLNFKHILMSGGSPKFIDFEAAVVSSSNKELQRERQILEELLQV